MKRRRFILSSATAVLAGSTSIAEDFDKPAVAVDFNISGVPSQKPSEVTNVTVYYSNLQITPQYINDNEEITITASLDLGEYGYDEREVTKQVSNADRKDISSSIGSLSVKNIDVTDESYIEGVARVIVDHPDITNDYTQRFRITRESIPSTVLTDDLISWYRFEDGDARDYASNNRYPSVSWGDSTEYKGSISGAVHSNNTGISDFENGSNSGAFEFDGQSDYIYNDDVPAFQDSERTIMAWCYISSKDSLANIVSLGSGLNNNERWSILLEDQTLNVGLIGQGNDYKFFDAGLVLDTWSHIAFTYDGDGLCKMYKDGEEFNSSNTTSFNTAEGMAVGTVASNDTREFFNGKIDDVRVYNSELTRKKVNSIYNQTKN